MGPKIRNPLPIAANISASLAPEERVDESDERSNQYAEAAADRGYGGHVFAQECARAIAVYPCPRDQGREVRPRPSARAPDSLR